MKLSQFCLTVGEYEADIMVVSGSLVADAELLDEAVGLPAQGSDVAPEKQQICH